MRFMIAPFVDSQTDQLLDCWRSALPFDEIGKQEFQRRVLLDDNFDNQGLIVAKNDNNVVVGFISCFILRKPIDGIGTMPDRGFIQAFGVSNNYTTQGCGSLLLESAEKYFADNDRKMIVLAPYTPNYFVPGVDKEHYQTGLHWLQKHGFQEYSEALAADANIATFMIPDALQQKEKALMQEGITIRHLCDTDICSYMNFQKAYMPGPWVEDSRRNLKEMTFGRFSPTAIWIAIKDGKIVGFCQHEDEHFGPFGVCDELQGKGIGSLLLAKTLHQMRIEGCHSAWVLWTGERALNGVYRRLGFKLTRRFAIMKKELAK